MTDDAGNLILEQLRLLRCGQEALQRGQEAIRADIAELKACATEIEATPGLALSQIGHLQVQIASQTSRIDRFEERLGRIVRRLDLALA